MEPPEDVNHMLILKLGELGYEFAQPPNPYCLTAIILGTSDDQKVTVNFWRGKPVTIEIRAERGIAPEKLDTFIQALERARSLLQVLEEEPEKQPPEDDTEA